MSLTQEIKNNAGIKDKTNYINKLINTYFILNESEEALSDENSKNDFLLLLKNLKEKDTTNTLEFKKSLNKSKKLSYLSNYSNEELSDMKLYLIKKYDIGFAIKKDGDIVNVFNNSGIDTPKVSNIGQELLKKAIKFGGRKLDHFDGKLTGIYSDSKFNKTSSYTFDSRYKPKNYNPNNFGINSTKHKDPILYFKDPKNFAYAEEFNKQALTGTFSKDMKKKILKYLKGMPDIIFREIDQDELKKILSESCEITLNLYD